MGAEHRAPLRPANVPASPPPPHKLAAPPRKARRRSPRPRDPPPPWELSTELLCAPPGSPRRRRHPTLPRARCSAPSGRCCCWWRDCHRCEIAVVLGAASRRGRCRVEAAPAPLLLASSWPPQLPVEHGLLLAIGPPPVNLEDDMHGSLGSSILLAARAPSLLHGPPPCRSDAPRRSSAGQAHRPPGWKKRRSREDLSNKIVLTS
ncbi:uncharacterized protein LOC119308673 isoform X2 [Triticum dicoccoides]|uniref:uncharacterized protein LOC119308673 isoform X2 n=1 Tax=Triticum dicoccoides TaxID=85692 RepID=UPI00188E4046|nr:uncharacterized protein LOC119308673 isoform X2 [Triticum dicoccoides]